MNEECSIPFSWYVDTSAKVLKYRDLNGPEKHVVFKKINIPAIFPNLPHSRKLQGYGVSFTHCIRYFRGKIPQMLILLNMSHPSEVGFVSLQKSIKHTILHLITMLFPITFQNS